MNLKYVFTIINQSKMKKTILTFLLLVFAVLCFSQNRKIKNVILFIPDGTSIDVLALTRWYNGNTPLALDNIICGMVKTHSSDGTIADSGPAGTAFATGEKAKSGYIGVSDSIIPLISVLELTRLKGRSTGIVVTCDFLHATPADFVCHYPDRKSYEILSEQFVFNSPSLVFSGGFKDINVIRSKEVLDTLAKRAIVVEDNLQAANYDIIKQGKSIWALFSDWKGDKQYMSHDIDKGSLEPSLADMTTKAIEILSQDKDGFFLMVEGSQVDWAAHNNDPVGVISDFMAFDRAVQVGLDFAWGEGDFKSNGHNGKGSTLIIVCPDHGTGGLSIGNKRSNLVKFQTDKTDRQYDSISYKEIIDTLKLRWTAKKIAETIIRNPDTAYRHLINKNYDSLLISKSDSTEIRKLANHKKEDKTDTLEHFLGRKFSDKHFIGWTTTGHTGEDVFLAVYHPDPARRLTGVVDNTRIANYIYEESIRKSCKKNDSLSGESKKYFNKIDTGSHSGRFSKISLDTIGYTKLVFENGKDKIIIPANRNYYLLNDKVIPLETLIVEINGAFYISKALYNTLSIKKCGEE